MTSWYILVDVDDNELLGLNVDRVNGEIHADSDVVNGAGEEALSVQHDAGANDECDDDAGAMNGTVATGPLAHQPFTGCLSSDHDDHYLSDKSGYHVHE